MELIDYFRILKALIILFSLFFLWIIFQIKIPNVLEETLSGFNPGAVKTILISLGYFKMALPLLQVLRKSERVLQSKQSLQLKIFI